MCKRRFKKPAGDGNFNILTEVANVDDDTEAHLQVESPYVVCLYNPTGHKYNSDFARDDDDRRKQLFACKDYL